MKSRFLQNTVSVMALTSLLGVGATTAAHAATDQEVNALKEQLRVLSERLQDLESKQVKTEEKVEDTRERAVLASGKSPGSFIIPGTNTEFTIGGYVKADFIYDLDQPQGDIILPEFLDVNPDDEDGEFRAHARQTRINIGTSTPTELGDLKTFVEGDFFGGNGTSSQPESFSNSFEFRLRHAYAEIGNLLVGQTWTNFMPLTSYPATVDFEGPAGIPFIRQAQVRYSHDVDDNLRLSASLENSELSGRNAAGNAIGNDNDASGIQASIDRIPDITGAVEYNDDWGQVRLAGVGRLLTSPNDSDDEFAYGVNISGIYSAWEGGNILGSFTYGDGVGRYIINGFGQDAFLDANGNLETIESYGVVAGVNHQFTDEILGQVVYGRSEFLDTFADTDVESVNTVHTSVFWTPLDRVTFGGEVIYFDRENQNGADVDAVRLQTSVQVNF